MKIQPLIKLTILTLLFPFFLVNCIVEDDGSQELIPPAIEDQYFSVEEKSPNGTILGTMVSLDEEEKILSYTIIGGDPYQIFAIDARSGDLFVNNSTHLDYDKNDKFELVVQVKEDTANAPSSYALAIINVLEVEDTIEMEEPDTTKTCDVSLVAHYPFDNNANDMSKYCNHGYVKNVVSSEDRHLNPNSAYYFNGENSYIAIPSSPSLNPTNQLTITAWLKVEDYPNRYTPILHKGGTYKPGFVNREYIIYVEDNGNIFIESSGDDMPHRYAATAVPGTNEWFMYSAVVDRINHKMKVFINGEFISEKEDDYSTFTNNNDSLKIGTWDETNSSYASFFKGYIDEIRIYNRSLTNEEISELYGQEN